MALLEKLTVAQQVRKYVAFYVTRSFITSAHKNPSLSQLDASTLFFNVYLDLPSHPRLKISEVFCYLEERVNTYLKN
jgi:hypothetical protein